MLANPDCTLRLGPDCDGALNYCDGKAPVQCPIGRPGNPKCLANYPHRSRLPLPHAYTHTHTSRTARMRPFDLASRLAVMSWASFDSLKRAWH